MPDTTATDATVHRLHALDNLRGILMWLGIVLHVAMIYAWLPSHRSWGFTALALPLLAASASYPGGFLVITGFICHLGPSGCRTACSLCPT